MDKKEEQKHTDEVFMHKALDEAEIAYEAGEIPIGAVVMCRGRVIAKAHNLTETLCDVTAHAEMQAITSAANAMGGKYLTDCTLCHGGALRDVRRSNWVGTSGSCRLRSV